MSGNYGPTRPPGVALHPPQAFSLITPSYGKLRHLTVNYAIFDQLPPRNPPIRSVHQNRANPSRPLLHYFALCIGFEGPSRQRGALTACPHSAKQVLKLGVNEISPVLRQAPNCLDTSALFGK